MMTTKEFRRQVVREAKKMGLDKRAKSLGMVYDPLDKKSWPGDAIKEYQKEGMTPEEVAVMVQGMLDIDEQN